MGSFVDAVARLIGTLIAMVIVAGAFIMIVQLTIPYIVWVVVMELRKLQVIP